MPNVPHVCVFDTAFHQTMPPRAYMYALPYEFYEHYGIRKYGAHGTSHRYIAMRTAEILGERLQDLKLITCHLGGRAARSRRSTTACPSTPPWASRPSAAS